MADNRPAIQVIQGDVTVEYIDLLVEEPRCLVLEVSTAQKHPEFMTGGSPEGRELMLYLTLPGRYDEQMTKIIFPVDAHEWVMIADGYCRYAIAVVLWKGGRTREERTTLWRQLRMRPVS